LIKKTVRDERIEPHLRFDTLTANGVMIVLWRQHNYVEAGIMIIAWCLISRQ
jgi:hypothetical protein